MIIDRKEMSATIKQHKILVVDDKGYSFRSLDGLLSSISHSVDTVKGGPDTLVKIRDAAPDLIFIDAAMSGMDGYKLCHDLKSASWSRQTPVILMNLPDNEESRKKSFNVGADDFLLTSFSELEVEVRSRKLLKLRNYDEFITEHYDIIEQAVYPDALEVFDDSQLKLKDSYLDTIVRLTVVAEYKDEDTASHIKRVGHYCSIIAEKLKMANEIRDIIKYAAPMHDIGKIGIPAEVLLKRGRLNNQEFELMKTHTIIGEKMLEGSISGYLNVAKSIAATHHERWDGKGYPNRLKGEEIPLEGRIMNNADQYDAMRSERPYKVAFDHDKTVNIIVKGDGRTMPEHFDPEVLAAFKESAEELRKIYEKYRD